MLVIDQKDRMTNAHLSNNIMYYKSSINKMEPNAITTRPQNPPKVMLVIHNHIPHHSKVLSHHPMVIIQYGLILLVPYNTFNNMSLYLVSQFYW